MVSTRFLSFGVQGKLKLLLSFGFIVSLRFYFVYVLASIRRKFEIWGKYKTWTPSVDPVHGPGPSKYGPGPWTPYFYNLRLHHKL